MKKDANNENFKWFFKVYIYPKKLWIAFVVILIFIGSTVGNISPYLYGLMLDSIVNTDLEYLFKLIVLYFLVTMGTTLFSLLESYIGQLLSFKMVKKSQKDLFKKIITLNQSSYDKYKNGEFISRLNGDSDSMVSFYLNVITSVMQIIINISISLYFVVTISLKLSSVALFYIPASFLVTFLSRKYYKLLAQKRKKLSDKYFSYLNVTFTNNVGIKVFGLEKNIFSKFDSFIQQELSLLKKSFILSSIIQVLSTFITVVSSLYIIYLSAVLIKSDLLTIGTMVSFNTYINKLFSSISQVLGLNISKQEVSVSLDRLWEIFSENSENIGDDLHDDLRFSIMLKADNISFRYKSENDEVINKLSFCLDKPGFYSFVGKNGCGKSTLAKLLIKLYSIDKGELLINGIDYNDCSVKLLRDSITYIQKEEFFFNDSIYNNLILANEKMTFDDVQKICKVVGINDFIEGLPDKYETIIGEGGSTLSSGQKQKLNVVRAILRNKGVIIFDEITANLDGKSEKEIISLLKSVSLNCIVIFISHNTTSIIQSDKIFVMDQGCIVDSGTHTDLIENNLIYQELFKNMDS